MEEGQILCWTDIPVIDLDRAITFYSAVLGAPVAKEEGQPGVHFGLLPDEETVSGCSGCLTAAGDNKPSLNGPLIYLSVEGRLDAAIAAVEPHGGRIMQGRHAIGSYGYRTVIVDSEGNRIALHSATA